MNIGDILSPQGVRVVHALTSKKRLFQELGDMSMAAWGVEAARVVEALNERETLGPTGVGHGVALPHARLAQVDRVRGLFIRLERALDFDAVDRQPVDLVFCLLAPSSAGVEHLKALALVARTLRDTSTCSKLRANADPAILYAILAQSPAIQAA